VAIDASEKSPDGLTGDVRLRFEPTFYELAEKRRRRAARLRQRRNKGKGTARPRVVAVPEYELPAGCVGTPTLMEELRLRQVRLSRTGLTRLKNRGVVTPLATPRVCTGRGRHADAWQLEVTVAAILIATQGATTL
jgi:hypothetical protein